MTNRATLLLLQIWVVTLFIVPADLVIRPLGGQATVANLIGISLGLIWIAARVSAPAFDAVRPSAVHLAIATMWLATLTAWVALARRGADQVTWNGAERWVMLLLAFSGVALAISDGLKQLEDLNRLAATTVAAAAGAGLIGMIQWRTSIDPSAWLRQLPGFSLVGDGVDTVVRRGEVGRVTGTALHPIEFGVGGALALPLALHLVIHDRTRGLLRRWLPLSLCAVSIPLSVSRSAVVVAVVVVGITVVALPAAPRLAALVVAPALAGVTLLIAPGTASTLLTSFLNAGEDSSIQARLDDVDHVTNLVGANPWWGLGGGTYLPRDVFEILDNQYFLTLVELGVIGGFLSLVGAFAVPIHLTGRIRRQRVEPAVRSLAISAGAVTLGLAASWATFDAMAFARTVGLGALALGLLGAAQRSTDVRPVHHDHSSTDDKEPTPWTQ